MDLYLSFFFKGINPKCVACEYQSIDLAASIPTSLNLTVFFVCVCLQEQPLGGPRIKHVCRAAAVALGQPRAMVPDDIPRLSALPLHEREGITFSPSAEGTVCLHVLF